MTIGGFQKLTLNDFPGHLSAIIFTRGCNFRCPYCHNPELVDPSRYIEPTADAEVFSFLRSRMEKLDGVVVTGGEPTIHSDLPLFLRRIRELGLSIKLDTNGSNPEMLGELIAAGLLDYVAMDIKASRQSYARIVGTPASIDSIRKSVQLLASCGLPHELRMTCLESLITPEELAGVAELARGCRLFVVQPFQPSKALDPRLLAQARTSAVALQRACELLRQLGLPAVVR